MSEPLLESGARLIVERAAADAAGALRAREIRAVLIRGPLQQDWLAAAGPRRVSRDVDLLVSPDDIAGADAALESMGLTRAVALPPDPGFEHAHDWGGPDRVPVELHWSVVGADAGRLWPVVAAETEPATIAGEPVEIPNEAARSLIVALHAAQHGVGDRDIFDDLERAVEVAPLDCWRRALDLARAVGAEVPFLAALSLTHRGDELLELLGAGRPRLTDRQALSLLTPAPSARGFYALAAQRSFRGKAALLASKLVPAPAFMRLRYPVARRGRLGLAAAYLYRPLWLARWAAPGFRSWRRARRLARDSGSDGARPR